MSHPLMHSVHRFHIPVMGTGFTIDTPLKVARYGISSVVSLVDDVLIEQMRRRLSGQAGSEYAEIKNDEEDSRARRITSYLNMLDEILSGQMDKLHNSLFAKGSELTEYFEMLPDSPLRVLYEKMKSVANPAERERLQATLRERITAGAIDVNIMTKLDRDRMRNGELLPAVFGDAMSALRGYANSRLESSLILSAGLNRRLFSYLAEFSDFFPDDRGEIRKRIVLKVSDYRSAFIQSKLLARKGLWVSEFRVESGLNCGGHAFGGKGTLMGPVLAEFKEKREQLRQQMQDIMVAALAELGRPVPTGDMCQRVTVQGGIGTAAEDHMLAEQYDVDGTGWASPFLLVPEVVNIDKQHLEKVSRAEEKDVVLSDASPLGVPFWCLQTSDSEESRRDRISEGKPGSACPKGFLVSNTEFTKVPICTASRNFQRRKLVDLSDQVALTAVVREDLTQNVLAKSCICHDLAGSATIPNGIDPQAHTAVCCGPNTVYFSQVVRLREMIDHIYGRAQVPLSSGRPHMFLKELSLHLDRLKQDLDRRRRGLAAARESATDEVRQNLTQGIQLYREQAAQLAADKKSEFLDKLEGLRRDLDSLID